MTTTEGGADSAHQPAHDLKRTCSGQTRLAAVAGRSAPLQSFSTTACGSTPPPCCRRPARPDCSCQRPLLKSAGAGLCTGSRTVTRSYGWSKLYVTVSRQHLGGVRQWWRCPTCHRRCRLLVATDPRAPIGCRLCLQARYYSDYPARDRRRRFVALVHALGSGRLDADEDEELDVLLAPRRRGVRRGRRIVLRTVRALLRLQARCEAIPAILQTGGLL